MEKYKKRLKERHRKAFLWEVIHLGHTGLLCELKVLDIPGDQRQQPRWVTPAHVFHSLLIWECSGAGGFLNCLWLSVTLTAPQRVLDMDSEDGILLTETPPSAGGAGRDYDTSAVVFPNENI